MLLGVVAGLLVATSQSVYYLLSRRYTAASGDGSLGLLVLSHLWSGILSLIALPLILGGHSLPPVQTWILPLLTSTGFYLAGHASLFVALKHAEASRVSPLLGLKVLMLAIASVTVLGDSLHPWQWLGVGLSVVAAFVLNYSGERLPTRVTLAALGACLGYSLSDLGIRSLNTALVGMGPTRGALTGCAMSLVLCGLIALPGLVRRPNRRQWRLSFPVGLSWFVAMGFLFITFAAVGVIYGNILQATRGLQSILMAVLVAHLGWLHLERKVQAGVFWRRLAAAVLMIAAIALYLIPTSS